MFRDGEVSKRESPYPMCLPGNSKVKKCSPCLSEPKSYVHKGCGLKAFLALDAKEGHIIGFRGGKATPAALGCILARLCRCAECSFKQRRSSATSS